MNRRKYLTTISAISTVAAAGCTGSSDSGPEEVAEQYLQAWNDGDAETQEELYYHDITPNEKEYDVEIITIKEITLAVRVYVEDATAGTA